jgi:5'-nucleotidase
MNVRRLGVVALALVSSFVFATGAQAHPGHGPVDLRGGTVSDGATIWGLEAFVSNTKAGGTTGSANAPSSSPVTIQFLNVSDWHGQLDPNAIVGVGNIGGAAVISSYWKQDRLANPNTLTLTAGDAFGATPPISGFFDDETAIKAMRLMGIQVDTFGNHNFDTSLDYTQNLIDLAGAPTTVEPGTPFSFVSANLQNVDDELDGVAPWKIFEIAGVKVGVVGITNPEAPTLVFPGRFGSIVPTSPYPAANKARAAATKAGADVVVLITHIGVTGVDAISGAPVGPLIDLANNVGGFDVIFGDHTDVQFQGIINGQLVLENRSRGLTYARTTVTVDPKNGKLISRSTQFVTPLATGVTPDPAIEAMLAPFRVQLSAILDEQIGIGTALFPRGNAFERSGESALGNLVADAMRLRYGTQLALTNGGGIRRSLPADNYLPANTALRRIAPPYAIGPPFDLVKGDVQTILPFGNFAVTRTVTGAQLWAALENGVSQINLANNPIGADGRFPQISGFRFQYDATKPAGSRVWEVTLTDGTPIPKDDTPYTFATNDFVNSGGDFYSMFADGQGVSREILADVLRAHIVDAGTVSPSSDGRITQAPAP